MSADYGDRLRAAFDDVMDVDGDKREEHARAHYADDAQLLADLLGMIATMGTESSFLEPLDETDVRVLLGNATESSEWPDEALPDLTGHVLVGRYRLGEEIGSGGASVVHAAVDELQDRPVAVKVLRHKGRHSKAALRRESSTLRLLRLPGVVQLLDEGLLKVPTHDGAEEELAFLVTERVEGNPWPGRSGMRTWDDLEQVTLALFESLERMHRAGIVHGDLKPGNVLVRPDGVPVILDLGIAEGPRAAARESANLARRGTLRYMAPEQVGGGLPTPRSDLYAVGLMLYETLTGRAYRSETTVELVRVGVSEDRPKPLVDQAPDAPPHVRDAVDRLLAHDPEQRPASAAEALDALRTETAPRDLPIDAPPGAVLDADALKPLFAGPDRLLHLQTDAAAELWRRTRGEADRLTEELDAWSRAGLGYWDDGIYHLRRREIEKLQQAIHPFAARGAGADAAPDLEPLDQSVLMVIELAGIRAAPALLARVLKVPQEQVDETLEGLTERGLVVREADGTLRLPYLPASVVEQFTTKDRRRFHARIASGLPKGDAQRLPHLIEAGRYDRVAKESLRVAKRLLEDGDAGRARATIELGLSTLDAGADPDQVATLLEQHLLTVLQVGSRGALDDHLHRLGRWPPSTRMELLERVAAGVLHALDGQPERALDELPQPEDAESDSGRRCTVGARLFAGRGCRGQRFREEIGRVEELASSQPDASTRAAAYSARAWQAYQSRRYEEAGALHREVARTAVFRRTRMLGLLNAASACLDGGLFDQAEEFAQPAMDLARAWRHGVGEAHAEYSLRAAAYRRGDVLEPDLELARAALQIGRPQLAVLIHVTEAAVAWRRGRLSQAHELAEAAIRIRRDSKDRGLALLARCLAAALRPSTDATEARALLEECETASSPMLAAQAAALVGMAWPPVAQDARCVAGRRAEQVDPGLRGFRHEILSIDEAVKSSPPECVTPE